MIDKWFTQDIEEKLEEKNRLVLIGEAQGSTDFLYRMIPANYTIYEAHDEVEELHVKYLIEKKHATDQVVIYTRTAKDNLKFLREYCETGNTLDIHHVNRYIRDKAKKHLAIDLRLPEEELLTAAKNSIGKDDTYWLKLGKGLGDIFDLEKDLLHFFHAPDKYLKQKDADVKALFLRRVNELIGQPFVDKKPVVLAKEVVHFLFDGLVRNKPQPTLLSVYKSWINSRSHESSFAHYLKSYQLPKITKLWDLHPDHPFEQVDEQALVLLAKNISDKRYTRNILPNINQRSANDIAQHLGISFWKEVKVLLDFEETEMNHLGSFDAVLKYYTEHFYKVDRVIRLLYTRFLNREEIIRPFQEFYENLNRILLDKWFRYLQPYQQTQTGLIERIIQENEAKTAVIVGDGVAYEIALGVKRKLDANFTISSDIVLADYPSETENNMSQLYIRSGAVESVHKKREKYLDAAVSKDVAFVHLDDVNEFNTNTPYLICTYKDIDELGEKMQQRALKLFETTEKDLSDKIAFLLNRGYEKVFLVADHGFVLTGLLSESDKIEIKFDGKVSKSERYIRTVQRQSINDNFIEMEKDYKEFKYLYFSNTTKPFKTPGVYGFSHGGLTPQELVTPYFCFEPKRNSHHIEEIKVNIADKTALQEVTGNVFMIKVVAETSSEQGLLNKRKCHLLLFSNGKQIDKSEVFEIGSSAPILKEFEFRGHDEIEIVLVDDGDGKQLDKATVTKGNARDLGGLM